MTTITETRRLASPAPFPQALAIEAGGTMLYMGSRETRLLYAIDVATLVVHAEIILPGTPWGATAAGSRIRLVCGEPPDDDRFIRSYTIAGDVETERLACPDNTGSYLAWDGRTLFLTQFYRRRLIELDAAGHAVQSLELPHDTCGVTYANGAFYVMGTDDEGGDEYVLTRVELGTPSAAIADVARVPFAARSLAWDGEQFWTNHRDRHEIVAFSLT